MAELVEIQAEIKFVNRKAARAVMRLGELAAEIAEDQPWNDAAREMVKAAKYALSHMSVEVKKRAT